MATNFLKYYTGSADGMALAVGFSFVNCAAGLGRMCTWSREGAAGNGLLGAWAVELGFNFVGNGLRISLWGSSTTSFQLPSSVTNGEIASFCCLQCSSTVVSIRHSSSGFSSSWRTCCWLASLQIDFCRLSNFDQFLFEVHKFPYPHCFP